MNKQDKLFYAWKKLDPYSHLGAVVQNDLTECTEEELKDMLIVFADQCAKYEQNKKEEWKRYIKLKHATKEYLNSVLKGKENK